MLVNNISEIVRDTIAVLKTDQVVEFYSDMMDKQATQFGHLLTAVVAIFTVLLGVSWFWNVLGMKKSVNNLIDSAKIEIQEDLNEWKGGIRKDLDTQISNKSEEINKSIQKNLKLHEAELDRLYGVSNYRSKNYIVAAGWFLDSFELYHVNEIGEGMEIAINASVSSLKECLNSDKLSEIDVDKLDEMEKQIEQIPNIYSTKRSEAKTYIKKIRAKFDKDNNNEK